MMNTINIDKDILLSSIVDGLGGGRIYWHEKKLVLISPFLGRRDWNTQELIQEFIGNGKNILYRGIKTNG